MSKVKNISFNTPLHPQIRYIKDNDKQDVIKDKKKYPYTIYGDVEVTIENDNNEIYKFIIPRNTKSDGATILRIFWRIIGPPSAPEFLQPAFLHDFLCSNKDIINRDRELSTDCFKYLLLKNMVNKTKVNIMCFFVDCYQRFFRNW